MIALHLLSKSATQAEEIALFLLKEKLIVNAQIINNVTHLSTNKEEPDTTTAHLVIGKTKALLFQAIDDALRNIYKENLPEIYSLPIVNMDWEQSNYLRETTAKV